MEKLINNINTGVLVKDTNKERKPSENGVYYMFWLNADDDLTYVYGFPKTGCYMFTKNEFERNIEAGPNVGPLSIFQLGKLSFFMLGCPSVLVKLSFDRQEKVVRIPMSVLKHALARNAKNPEDSVKPGILNRVAEEVVNRLR